MTDVREKAIEEANQAIAAYEAVIWSEAMSAAKDAVSMLDGGVG